MLTEYEVKFRIKLCTNDTDWILRAIEEQLKPNHGEKIIGDGKDIIKKVLTWMPDESIWVYEK